MHGMLWLIVFDQRLYDNTVITVASLATADPQGLDQRETSKAETQVRGAQIVMT